MKFHLYRLSGILIAIISIASISNADSYHLESGSLRKTACEKRSEGFSDEYSFPVYSTEGLFLGRSQWTYKEAICNRGALKLNQAIDDGTSDISLDVYEGWIEGIEKKPKKSIPLAVAKGKLSCDYAQNVAKTIISTGCAKPLSVSLVSCTDEIGVRFTSLAACAANIPATECYDSYLKAETKNDKQKLNGGAR